MELYPSLMGADQLRLAAVIDQLEPWCAGFHLDIMDGHAVPNITGGPAWANAIARYAKKPAWVHCMVTDPLAWIERLELKPQSMVDFQYEGVHDPESIIAAIKKKGCLAGISIAPATSIEQVRHMLPLCDYINVMGVNPGFSGQTFMPAVTHKITTLAELIRESKLSCMLACDGGIAQELLPMLQAIGVLKVAVASALFNTHDPVKLLQRYQQ